MKELGFEEMATYASLKHFLIPTVSNSTKAHAWAMPFLGGFPRSQNTYGSRSRQQLLTLNIAVTVSLSLAFGTSML